MSTRILALASSYFKLGTPMGLSIALSQRVWETKQPGSRTRFLIAVQPWAVFPVITTRGQQHIVFKM